MQEITLGSLFDGIGGFPYAASFYGIHPLWASEIVPSCVSVTKKFFPDMAHVGDVTRLDGAKLPPVDIITFGSPCQGLSLAGQRRGLADERSGLFLEAIRIIFEMREATHGKYPRFALFENVPGALSSAGGFDYQVVLQSFTKAEVPIPRSGKWADAGMVRGGGVDLAWCVYDAQYFGTAQRRRRLFLVADFGGKRAGEILFVPKSLRRYFETGGTPRQGLTAFAESGAGTAGAGELIPATMRIRCGCEGGGKGPLLQIEKSGTLATGNDQYLFAPKDAVEILNDQGGDSLCVEKGGVSPTLRSQTHGNLPITAYAIQSSMIGGEDSPHAVTNSGCTAQFPPDAMVGINGNLAGTLLASYYKGTGMRCGRERDVVLCASSGQSHAEILRELSPTLNCASEQPYVVRPDDTGQEQPIVTHPQIAGTLCASGAGLSRPAGQGNELDFCVMSAGFKHKAGCQSGSIGFQEETAPTLLAGQQSAVMKACLIGGAAVMEAQTAAVDCRNLRETDEVSGTLLAKAVSGGYSLNYQNPVRTGLCVRRLTPTEAERLQGYPDGWTEAGADGSPISDTKRYQMLGNSIAVPCVAYIMQGITDAVNQACEKGGKKL